MQAQTFLWNRRAKNRQLSFTKHFHLSALFEAHCSLYSSSNDSTFFSSSQKKTHCIPFSASSSNFYAFFIARALPLDVCANFHPFWFRHMPRSCIMHRLPLRPPILPNFIQPLLTANFSPASDVPISRNSAHAPSHRPIYHTSLCGCKPSGKNGTLGKNWEEGEQR